VGGHSILARQVTTPILQGNGDAKSLEFVFRKWDNSPHWVHQEVLLGVDDCGTWIGQQKDWTSIRPGRLMKTDAPNVTVVRDGAGWVATFFGAEREHGIRIYVDLVADLRLDTMTAIDMDLDVILNDRGVWIDDEDEFADHRVAMGYPDDVVARVEHDAQEVARMIAAGEAPFDGRAERWLAQLA
jgi:protein associated with RNAse G/E